MTGAPRLFPTGVIAAAEHVLGVAYSEAERELMAGTLGAQLEQALARRGFALPGEVGPAQCFDPRLPGFVMPDVAAFEWAPVAAEMPEDEAAIAFAPIAALAGWIRDKKLSCTRLVEIYLARIAALDGQLLSYATVTDEAARARAAALDGLLAQGVWLGPLHGIPYGMKDIIDTAGVETAWGAEPYQGRVPERDAFIAGLLFQAGAVMLGKTAVGALAYGDLWYRGRTRNPWNLAEGASGSSAGSACAVAAGLAAFAVGTETLGSIVSPATRCGVVGLRPSYGRISRRGAMALCWSLDKIGPMARCVDDAALVLDVLNVADPADEFQIAATFGGGGGSDVAGLRVGYFAADFNAAEATDLDREMLARVRGLGVTLVALERLARPYDAMLAILFAEAAAAFETLTSSGRDDELTWQDADAWPNQFRMARFLSAVDHVQADRLRRLVMQDMAAVFENVDVLIGPSLVRPMLTITNFTGHPCVCLPAGFTPTPTRAAVSLASSGLESLPDGVVADVPHSICLWGRLYDEAPMLRLGRALEAALGLRRRPDLSCVSPDETES